MNTRGTVPPRESYDGLMVMGGSMRSHETEDYPWISEEIEMLSQALESNTPTLGVCLGAQFLCEADGGKVEIAKHPERQYQYMRVDQADPLAQGLPPLLALYDIHMDIMIPDPQVKHFIRGGWCPQGLRFRPAVWGVQFHPEFSLGMAMRWHQGLKPQLQQMGSGPARQNRHFLRHIASQYRYGARIIQNFVKEVERSL